MTEEDALHRIITKFMLNSCCCRINENPISDGKLADVFASIFANSLFGDGEAFSSGSFAELYIRPMVFCFGDVDIMHNFKTERAIPYGMLLHPELLDCHQDLVTVYEIIDSHKPGYVYLQQSYVVRKNENGRYVVQSLRNHDMHESMFCNNNNSNLFQQIFEKDNIQRCFNEEICNNHFQQIIEFYSISIGIHGPAQVIRFNSRLKPQTDFRSNFDYVSCVFCPTWPQQAADWPIRNRHHGWPDQPTIDLVVSGACHVVGAVHPSCRDDHWEINYQCRLSFSRAEVTMLNSWTLVQQIVYHMLRIILKLEVFSKIDEKEKVKFSNYHLKTEMLWACEQNPSTCWSEESSLVKLCSRLLLKLSDCVAERHCQHYFISSCNLLDYLVGDDSWLICNNLRTLADESVLLSWFSESYIRECAQCADVPVLFEHYSCIDEVEKTMKTILDWQLSKLSYEMYNEYRNIEETILFINLVYRRDAEGTLMIMKELQHCDSRVRGYFVALVSLRVAYRTSIHSLTADLLEVLWAIFLPCNLAVFDTTVSGLVSARQISIRKAIKLVSLSSIPHNALGMIQNEMAKAYLHQSLTCDQDSTYLHESCCLIHVLLGALYYKSGQYRAAIANCKQMVNQPAYDDCGLCYLEAEQLPHIDTSVDRVFGLILFYQYVRQTALNSDVQRQQNSKPVVSAELLVQYLYSICLTGLDEKRLRMIRYCRHLFCSKQPMLTDVLLFKSAETQLSEYIEIPVAADGTNDVDNNASSSVDTSLLVTSLEQVALEKLINFRQVIVRELHSDEFPVVNEFELLDMYRRGMFPTCLRLCRNHIICTFMNSGLEIQTLSLSSPVYLSLFDGELSSLFGIIRILYPSWILLYTIIPLLLKRKSSIAPRISLLTVLLYLMIQCQTKLHGNSVCDSLVFIRYAHDTVFCDEIEHCFDRLILKMIYRISKLCIDDAM